MYFDINSIDQVPVTDQELTDLLNSVYVDDGFTSAELASTLFIPRLVRKRGVIFTARVQHDQSLAGMIIVVPPTSNARVLAKANECEMHLLGVKSAFRGLGIGRRLVEQSLAYANTNDWSKMILWTQQTMFAAQKLYESCGFIRTGELSRNDIDFYIYERHSA